jgi:aspartate aminotransferase
MRRRGIEVLDFSAGRAAESSPGTINRAAADSLLGGDTHQTQARGRPEYLQNIVHRLKKDNGLDLDPAKNIIATINCMGDMVGTIVVAHSEGWKPVSSKG